MTSINYWGIGLFLLILGVGIGFKIYTGKKVKSLEGLEGVVSQKDEGEKGKIVGQFGD